MYAIEYTKQQRTAPAVITVAIHLALLYAVAVGLHVVPSPLSNDAMKVVNVPVTPLEPVQPVQKPADPHNDAIDLSHVIPTQPPTFVVAQDLSQGSSSFEVAVPDIDVGTGDTIVAESVTDARIKHSPEPPYPLISRAREEEGTVILKIMVSPYGTAGDVQVERSSGFSRLDDAAVKAARSWKFSPGKRGSQAIATWISVPVTFVLNGRS